MIRSICRQLKPIHRSLSTVNTLNTLSIRNASLLFEMRSGRVGKVTIDTQKELDKIFERYIKTINYILL